MTAKTLKIIQWILIGLLTLQFFAAGVSKLGGSWNIRFETWGYPAQTALIIGALEVLAIPGLYFKQVRLYSILLITVIMIGAIYTHIMASEYSRILHNSILILMALGLYSIDRRVDILNR